MSLLMPLSLVNRCLFFEQFKFSMPVRMFCDKSAKIMDISDTYTKTPHDLY